MVVRLPARTWPRTMIKLPRRLRRECSTFLPIFQILLHLRIFGGGMGGGKALLLIEFCTLSAAPITVTVPALASGSDPTPAGAGSRSGANSESLDSKAQAPPAGKTMTVTQSKSSSKDQLSPPVTVTISDFYSDVLSSSSFDPTIAPSPPPVTVTISPPPPVTIISQPPLPPSPIPPPTTIFSICASNNNFAPAESIQVYYIDSTGSIMMNQHGAGWSGYDGVHLSISPKPGSPLSSISWSYNANDVRDLFS